MKSLLSKRPTACWLAAGLVLSLMLASDSLAKIPDGKELPSNKQFLERAYAFEAKHCLDGYDAHGVRDPKWDAAARVFIDEFLRGEIVASPTVTREDLYKKGTDLVQRQHCTDPLVEYFYTWVIEKPDPTYDKAKRSPETALALKAQGYDPAVQFWAITKLSAAYAAAGMREQTTNFDHKLLECLPELFRQHQYAPADRDILCNQLFLATSHFSAAYRQMTDEALFKVPDVDPVAKLLIEGLAHISTAWEVRGGGYANTVTPEQWKMFGGELERASNALTKAWELDKTIPEPPTAMIQVAMGSQGGTDMRLWFDRAVAARFDYREAYMKYMYGLYPRWHGDRQALYDFAIECSENTRMDSVVPLFAVDVCSAIRSECDDGQSTIWNDPRIYGKLKNVLEHSTYYGTTKFAIRQMSSSKAAFFATTGHWDEARKAVDATDAPLEQNVVASIVELMSRDLRGMILANTGPTGANVLRARKLHADGKREPALAVYRAALKSNKDPDAIQHLNGLILNVQREIDFAAGKQVSLQPDARFTGIEGYKGLWGFDKEGGFIGTCTTQQRLRIVYPADFGDAWELKTDFEFGVHQATWDVAGVLLVMPAGKEDLGVVIQTNPTALIIRIGQFNDLAVAQAAVLPGVNSMTVRRDGKMLTVYLNGQQLYSGPALAHDPQHQARIGLGGNPFFRGDTVHFKSVTIHKLSL